MSREDQLDPEERVALEGVVNALPHHLGAGPEILAEHLIDISVKHGMARLLFAKHKKVPIVRPDGNQFIAEAMVDSCTLVMGTDCLVRLRDQLDEFLKEAQANAEKTNES